LMKIVEFLLPQAVMADKYLSLIRLESKIKSHAKYIINN